MIQGVASIEPYQGAATGVGGILRDVFTMGARPICNLNALRFGEVDHEKTRHLVSGVVEGISGYGNCVGVPTVAGECEFHKSYNGNNLVNAMAVGLADKNNIFYSAAAGVGNPVVYFGSKTGRDGIHGATMASAEFTEDSEEKRPTVQVGDPFTEKLLIEATLELMQTGSIVAIQDMGAAGLTSSSFEMASKGGVGVELELDQVPMREEGMTPYELMLSESQERMLVILKPGMEDIAKAVMDKWDLDFAVIGKLTDTGNMVLKWHGEVVGDLPIDPLALASPEYDRPWVKTERPAEINAADVDSGVGRIDALKTLIAHPNFASKRWIWEQYDHMVMGDTVGRPGGDSAIVRVHESNKGIAVTSDCTPRYCYQDPHEGGKQIVAETYRNITAVGAKPMAVTDNLNFGNPERPEIMGQIVGCIEGIGEACRALDYPIVSGNVSLYNETNGQGILPTPTLGAVGLINDISDAASVAFKEEGQAVVVLGDTKGWLGASRYLEILCGREEGAPPPVDLDAELKTANFVREEILAGINTCHDISDGGIAVAVTEMAMAGNIGCDIEVQSDAADAWLFGEDQGRYIVTVPAADADAFVAKAGDAGVSASIIGKTGGSDVILGGEAVAVAELKSLHENWMPDYMAAGE